MNYSRQPKQKTLKVNRIQLLRVLLIIIGSVFIFRLFYIQIVKHEYYQSQALAEHIKKFEISAPRGIIRFQDGDKTVPVVLNEPRYIIYADPKYISDSEVTASKIVEIIGGNKKDIKKKLETDDSRYVVLAKKMTKAQVNRIDALNIKGIGKKETMTRTYPQGSLAAHLLGFVNDDGKGQYGIEEYMNDELAGKPGLERAITDIKGVPLAVNNDNILQQAKPGKDLTLTIDLSMQQMAEDYIKSGVDRTSALRGSVIIMEINTGAIKAMANYPTYNPSQYDKINDQSIFINTATSMPWEPGSVMKPLTVSASLNEGKSNPNTSYFDPGYVKVGDRTVTNAVPWGAQNTTIRDVLVQSLNTGAVFALKTLGDGSINSTARNIWYKYLTDHYRFNKQTGVQQTGETVGYIADPNEGDGLEVRYSNTSFGQGLSVTPIQLIAAYAAVINGGNYYKPTLIADSDKNGKVVDPKSTLVAKDVVSINTSEQIKDILRNALEVNNKAALRKGYVLGAKSGTAEVADKNGNYRTDVYNGSYIGYIGGADGPKYIMLVRIDEPKTSGFASAQAYKIWDEISNKLIDIIALKPIGG
jgi:cell division protein FtsI (penicillin-binding protein 3)/stage V sporulation protein D (sporulation-specific penicillin-binding protein)